jgi:hypothetical protein
MFRYLSSLKYLKIKDAFLSLSMDTFKNLVNVDTTVITNFGIPEKDPEVFASLKRLKTLDLSQNSLDECRFKIPEFEYLK